MRISIKQLEERIETINSLTNNKYNIKLFATKGCGVDICINGEWQATDLKNHFTNKEAMELLNKRFGKEIRSIILGN
jgi:hypothetical protein